jgi:transcriptional regulator with XRE-family HTH domain
MNKHHDLEVKLRAILAENMRAYRQQHGISQEALAEACGLHRTYIGSVERAERNVTLRTLAKLAVVLGVSVPQLLTPNWLGGMAKEQGQGDPSALA